MPLNGEGLSARAERILPCFRRHDVCAQLQRDARIEAQEKLHLEAVRREAKKRRRRESGGLSESESSRSSSSSDGHKKSKSKKKKKKAKSESRSHKRKRVRAALPLLKLALSLLLMSAFCSLSNLLKLLARRCGRPKVREECPTPVSPTTPSDFPLSLKWSVTREPQPNKQSLLAKRALFKAACSLRTAFPRRAANKCRSQKFKTLVLRPLGHRVKPLNLRLVCRFHWIFSVLNSYGGRSHCSLRKGRAAREAFRLSDSLEPRELGDLNVGCFDCLKP